MYIADLREAIAGKREKVLKDSSSIVAHIYAGTIECKILDPVLEPRKGVVGSVELPYLYDVEATQVTPAVAATTGATGSTKQEVLKSIAGFCIPLTGDRNNRKSFDPAPVDANYNFMKDKIGNTFPFQGRHKESEDMYQTILQQDDIRMRAQMLRECNKMVDEIANWESFKRFPIPVSMGIAGIGKSEFSRKGLFEYVKRVNRADFDAASAREQSFIAIMRDENKCCNIRLAMDEIFSPAEFGVDTSIMVELLYVALHYNLRDNLPKRSILNVVRSSQSIELADIIDFLIEFLGVEAFLVNIDEANSIDESSLSAVLKLFGKELCMGRRVYITVSDIYRQSVRNALTFSRMGRKDIFLPPLSMEQSLTIFHSLGLVPCVDHTKQNKYLLHLLWLAGGVPRYLDYLILTIARKCIYEMDVSFCAADLPIIADYIATMTQSEVIHVLGLWCSLCVVTSDGFPSDTAVANIISLCVAETAVNNGEGRRCMLASNYSIENALQEQMLYIQSVDSYIVTLPPVFLYNMHRISAGKDAVRVITLQGMDGVMSSRDNEELYLSVLIHRLRAASIMGKASILLYDLLGTDRSIDGQSNEHIDTAHSWTLTKTDSTVKTENFLESAVVGSGKVNTPTASFADAFIRLKVYRTERTVDVLIQEKQSVIGRRKRFEVSKVPKTTRLSSVHCERAKIVADSLLVYITDCGQAEGEEQLFEQYKTLVITASEMEQGFGKFATQLKRFCLAQSYIDVK